MSPVVEAVDDLVRDWSRPKGHVARPQIPARQSHGLSEEMMHARYQWEYRTVPERAHVTFSQDRKVARLLHASPVVRHSQPVSDVARLFSVLADIWQEDTMFLSSVSEITKHPAYRAVVRMGKPMLPFIIADLQRKPGHWFVALQQITGENPARGAKSVRDASRAWIEWGKARGLAD